MLGRRTPEAFPAPPSAGRSRLLALLATGTLAGSAGTLVSVQDAAAAPIACDNSSLMSAISSANSAPGGGTVTLAKGCVYTLTAKNNTFSDGPNGLPAINGTVRINGNGATIRRSASLTCTPAQTGGCFRFLYVRQTGVVQVNSLTFSNGAASPKWVLGGGAIVNRGKLSLTDVTFNGDSATAPNTTGGGAIDNHDFGQLTVTRSTFIGNQASEGGAIMDDASNAGTYVKVSQSTFSGNISTEFDGGALENIAGTSDTLAGDTFVGNRGKGGAAVYASGTMSISDTTFTDNVAGTDGGGAIQNAGQLSISQSTFFENSSPYGANIHTYYLGSGARPLTSLQMTIVADGQGGGDNCDGSDPVTDSGYNLDTGVSCGFSTGQQSIDGTQPGLEALAPNGGPTETMALPVGSPAADRIPANVSGCSGSVDQRGVSRPQGTGCDIGAYEIIVTTGDTQPPTTPTGLEVGSVTAYSVALSWNPSSDEVGVTGYTVYRNGVRVGATGGARATSFTDTSAAPGTSYRYTVDAFDGGGNHSRPSSPASVTTRPPGAVAAEQSAAAATGDRVASTTLSLPGEVHGGDLLVGWFGQYDASGDVQVSDSVNGHWTRGTSMTFGGSGDIAMYYVQDSAASSFGLTVTVSASSPTYLEGAVGEYSGVAVSGALDQVAAASGAGTAVDSGPTPGVAAGELVIGAILTANSPGSATPGSTQGQPFTLRAQTADASADLEDVLAGSAGAQDARASLGTSTDWYAVAAVFRPFDAE